MNTCEIVKIKNVEKKIEILLFFNFRNLTQKICTHENWRLGTKLNITKIEIVCIILDRIVTSKIIVALESRRIKRKGVANIGQF